MRAYLESVGGSRGSSADEEGSRRRSAAQDLIEFCGRGSATAVGSPG